MVYFGQTYPKIKKIGTHTCLKVTEICVWVHFQVLSSTSHYESSFPPLSIGEKYGIYIDDIETNINFLTFV